MLYALFVDVKNNSAPHLFTCGEPWQMGAACENDGVFIELATGCPAMFTERVEQFGGVTMGERQS